MAAYN